MLNIPQVGVNNKLNFSGFYWSHRFSNSHLLANWSV